MRNDLLNRLRSKRPEYTARQSTLPKLSMARRTNTARRRMGNYRQAPRSRAIQFGHGHKLMRNAISYMYSRIIVGQSGSRCRRPDIPKSKDGPTLSAGPLSAHGRGGGEEVYLDVISSLRTGEYADWYSIRGEGHKRVQTLCGQCMPDDGTGRWRCGAAPTTPNMPHTAAMKAGIHDSPDITSGVPL